MYKEVMKRGLLPDSQRKRNEDKRAAMNLPGIKCKHGVCCIHYHHKCRNDPYQAMRGMEKGVFLNLENIL